MADIAFNLCGTGSFLPQKQVSSKSLDRQIGKREGWLEENCGVRERFVCGPESQDELAASAAKEAIAEAGISPLASISYRRHPAGALLFAFVEATLRRQGFSWFYSSLL